MGSRNSVRSGDVLKHWEKLVNYHLHQIVVRSKMSCCLWLKSDFFYLGQKFEHDLRRWGSTCLLFKTHLKVLGYISYSLTTTPFQITGKWNCLWLWKYAKTNILDKKNVMLNQIARFMGPTWGLPGSCRPQEGPMLAPWTSLSGLPPFWPRVYEQYLSGDSICGHFQTDLSFCGWAVCTSTALDFCVGNWGYGAVGACKCDTHIRRIRAEEYDIIMCV